MSFDKLRMIEGLGFTPTLTLPLRGRGFTRVGGGNFFISVPFSSIWFYLVTFSFGAGGWDGAFWD